MFNMPPPAQKGAVGLVGQREIGKVKSWNPVKGFGFLVSTRFAGDLFFDRDSFAASGLPEQCIQDGLAMEFLIDQDNKGRARAKDLVPGRPPASDMLGMELEGWIKSFQPRKNWGFIQSEAFGGDVFLHGGEVQDGVDAATLQPRTPVRFTICIDPKNGRAAAQRVTVLDGGLGGLSTNGAAARPVRRAAPYPTGAPAGAPAGPAPKPIPQEQADALMGTPLVGRVRKVMPDKSYGFVNSDDFEGDLFFHFTESSQSLHHQGCQGTRVSFVMGNKEGKPRAEHMEPIKCDIEELMDSRLGGTVKSYNPAKSFGFVVSPAFEGDLFIHASHNDFTMWQPQQGASVNFHVGRDKQGRPCATGMTPVGATAPHSAPAGKGGQAGQVVPQLLAMMSEIRPLDVASTIQYATQANPALAAALGSVAGGPVKRTPLRWQ